MPVFIALCVSASAFAAGPFNSKRIARAPTIGLNNNSGYTDYIDFLTAADFPKGVSLVRFVDSHGRSGIAIRYDVKHVGGECRHMRPSCEGSNFVTAFFQRYSNDENFWVSGGHAGREEFDRHPFNSAITLAQIEKLLDGEIIDYTFNGARFWMGLSKG